MNGKAIHSKRLISLLLVAALVAATQAIGCATPEQKHRVLAFFFDGVPPLHPEEAPPTPADQDQDEPPRLARVRPQTRVVSVHGPVAAKECDECHASEYSNQLRQPKEDVCWSCHDREDFSGEVVHGPVAAGLCGSCHEPHRSQYPFLLVKAPADLCGNCHDQTSSPGITEHRAEKGNECDTCHDPHAARRKYMLKRDGESS